MSTGARCSWRVQLKTKRASLPQIVAEVTPPTRISVDRWSSIHSASESWRRMQPSKLSQPISIAMNSIHGERDSARFVIDETHFSDRSTCASSENRSHRKFLFCLANRSTRIASRYIAPVGWIRHRVLIDEQRSTWKVVRARRWRTRRRIDRNAIASAKVAREVGIARIARACAAVAQRNRPHTRLGRVSSAIASLVFPRCRRACCALSRWKQ